MSDLIHIPDIGSDEAVEVIEISVKQGESFQAEQTLVVLESDKASMEIPAPSEGTVKALLLSVGDQVKAGDAILQLASVATNASDGLSAETTQEPPQQTAQASDKTPEAAEVATSGQAETIYVPDLGTDDGVEIVEVNVALGDHVAQEQTLLVLESDKASMEIPAPSAGEVTQLHVTVGDTLKTGDAILEMLTASAPPSIGATEPTQVQTAEVKQAPPSAPAAPAKKPVSVSSTGIRENQPSQQVYAGPAVRLLARELGVDLAQVPASGPKGRVLKEDVQQYVKQKIQQVDAATGSAIPVMPEIDFSAFGDIRIEPMTKLQKITASNMQRNWLNIPHVTQFDELDVSDLEAFRKEQKEAAQARGVKLTPLAFIFKALAAALKNSPKFNASLHHDGESIVYKEYVHIGLAVDTPQGLVVPVIRDVDQKTIWELAEEIASVAQKARDRKLRPNDMKGACFTVSSLGGIGGTGFTPIINGPEVAILGVARMAIKPVWNAETETFQPHKMLPVSLSYDHRAVNGADAGRFLGLFSQLIGDLRQLALLG